MAILKYLIPVLSCAWLPACAPARMALPPAPAAVKAVPVQLTAEQKKKVEQLYYKAVGAYSNNDMPASSAFLGEIFAIHPAYPPALELKRKISLAAGLK